MKEKHERRVSPLLFALVILLGLLLIYVLGYFWLGSPGTVTSAYGTLRIVKQASFFSNKTWATIFRPAAAVESLFRDEEVLSTYQSQ